MKKIIVGLLLIITLLITINLYVYKNISGDYKLNSDLINQISLSKEDYISVDKVPEDLINAIVSIEDARFYKHIGFDVIGIGRATIENIKEKRFAEGGSTITQQLVKNLFYSNEKSFERKLQELVVAVDLEIMYSKDEILEMYLNVIYYGEGAYGIKNASKTYFDKEVEELSLEESAMIAGIIQAPSIYNPKVNPEKAKERQEIVLELIQE